MKKITLTLLVLTLASHAQGMQKNNTKKLVGRFTFIVDKTINDSLLPKHTNVKYSPSCYRIKTPQEYEVELRSGKTTHNKYGLLDINLYHNALWYTPPTPENTNVSWVYTINTNDTDMIYGIQGIMKYTFKGDQKTMLAEPIYVTKQNITEQLKYDAYYLQDLVPTFEKKILGTSGQSHMPAYFKEHMSSTLCKKIALLVKLIKEQK